MSKTLIELFLGVLVLVMASPVSALAPSDSCRVRGDTTRLIEAAKLTCPAANDECEYAASNPPDAYDGGDCAMCCTLGLLLYVTDIAYAALMVGVVLFISWGAYEITTSAGDPKKFAAGRSRIIYAAIGLGAALLIKAIPLIIGSIV